MCARGLEFFCGKSTSRRCLSWARPVAILSHSPPVDRLVFLPHLSLNSDCFECQCDDDDLFGEGKPRLCSVFLCVEKLDNRLALCYVGNEKNKRKTATFPASLAALAKSAAVKLLKTLTRDVCKVLFYFSIKLLWNQFHKIVWNSTENGIVWDWDWLTVSSMMERIGTGEHTRDALFYCTHWVDSIRMLNKEAFFGVFSYFCSASALLHLTVQTLRLTSSSGSLQLPNAQTIANDESGGRRWFRIRQLALFSVESPCVWKDISKL